MPLKLAKTRGTGLPNVPAPMPLRDSTTDFVLRSFAQQLGNFRRAAGVVLAPDGDIAAAFAVCADGDRVLLLPGTYVVTRDLVVDKRLELVGSGAVLEFAQGVSLLVTASDVVLRDIVFVCRNTSAPVSFATVSGNRCTVRNCSFDVDADRAVSVTGDYCGLQGCRFTGARTVAGADVYYADGATYGIVCGTMWNGDVATFAVDYRGIDQTSEAANGPAAIINVR